MMRLSFFVTTELHLSMDGLRSIYHSLVRAFHIFTHHLSITFEQQAQETLSSELLGGRHRVRNNTGNVFSSSLHTTGNLLY